MYGSVRTVVWEGSSRKARPYPDQPRAKSAKPWVYVPLIQSPNGANQLPCVHLNADPFIAPKSGLLSIVSSLGRETSDTEMPRKKMII